MRTIPFAVLSSDYTSLIVSGAPTATIQYGSGAAASAAVTQRGNGWSVDVDETQDALVIVTLAGAAPCALTVLAARAAVVADKTGYALTPAYDHAKDDVLTPLATVGGKADTLVARREAMDPAATQASAAAALTAQGLIPTRAAKLDQLPDTVVASKADVDAAREAIDAKPVTPAAPTVSDIVQGINAGGEGLASITEATIPDGTPEPIGGIKVGGVLTAGVLVEALKPDGSLADSTRTDGDGGFRLLVPTGATYTVRFSYGGATAASEVVTV